MTRPGSPPSRGQHAAPDDDARPDEDLPVGRHAVPDPPRRRHAAPELNGYGEPPRRRHAAPEDEPYESYEPYEAGGRHAAGGGLNGHARPAGYGRHLAEPQSAPADPSASGFGYHRPEPNGARPWGEVNGYHLEAPAPPAVNGYHLDEPVAPVNGFPYTAPPPAPIPHPVNGHGVDAAEREAASWPVDTSLPALEPYGYQRPAYQAPPVEPPPVQPSRYDAAPVEPPRVQPRRFGAPPVEPPPVQGARFGAPPVEPQIAVVPLQDEPTETLARPDPVRPAGRPTVPARDPDQPDGTSAGKPEKPPHPPRAVVRRRRARRRALEWPLLIVFALVSAFLIRQYVVQTFFIPSASMHETLIEGDRVLVNKVSYHLHDIHRGDVVVFRKPPGIVVDEDDLIKRVVAVPGETVEGRGGKVYVNGAPLDEPYVEPLCHGTGEFGRTTVPVGKLWVMGDNRCNSSDSRVFGPIPENLVVGRAFVIAWPFDRLSWL